MGMDRKTLLSTKAITILYGACRNINRAVRGGATGWDPSKPCSSALLFDKSTWSSRFYKSRMRCVRASIEDLFFVQQVANLWPYSFYSKHLKVFPSWWSNGWDPRIGGENGSRSWVPDDPLCIKEIWTNGDNHVFSLFNLTFLTFNSKKSYM